MKSGEFTPRSDKESQKFRRNRHTIRRHMVAEPDAEPDFAACRRHLAQDAERSTHVGMIRACCPAYQ